MKEAERGLLAKLNACRSPVSTGLYFAERGLAKNFFWYSCCPWSLLLTHADLTEAWLFLLSCAAAAAAIQTLPHWTAGVSMKSLHVDATADL